MSEVLEAVPVEGIQPISARHARRLGINRFSALRTARDLKMLGIITEDMSNHEIATAIAVEMAADRADEMELCMAEDGRDWSSFFAALIKFLEALMPFIMLFI